MDTVISLKIPGNKIKLGKVYSLCFWAKNASPAVVKIDTKPASIQPFGHDFLLSSVWNKVVFPFVIEPSSLGYSSEITLTLPPNTILEAPELYADDTGILPYGNQVVQYLPGKNWRPVYMGNSNGNFLPIKKGSALDFSNIPVRVPAGEKGRLTINKEGKLAFEDDLSTPVRFRSCSFPFRTNIGKGFIDNYINNLMLQGYNMVRFHGPVFKKSKYYRYGVTIEDVSFIPQNEEDFREYFDEERLQRFDYILEELGKRGIYVYFDIMASFAGWTDAQQPGHWVGKDLQGKEFNAQLYVNEEFRQNWKAGITYLLNRTNTVNGKKWKDDPVFACMLFMNEQDFRVTPSYLSAFEPDWQQFYGPNAPKLSEKLLKSDSADGCEAADFMLEKIEDMNQFYINTIRKVGYKGLVTNWDLYMRMIDAPGWADMDVISLHSYHGHPGLPRKGSSVPGYKTIGNREIAISTQSSIADNGKYLARILSKRNINAPCMIMEYADVIPNPYRHEAGLFVASYSALNGIDVLQPHGSMLIVNDHFSPLKPHFYSDYRDPIYRASDVVNVFGFLRGDVETAKHNVEFLVTPKILESANRLDALSIEYTKTFLLTKVGMRYSQSSHGNNFANIQADLEIVPRHFARAAGMSVEAVTTIENSQIPEISRKIVRDLRKLGILSENNKTNLDKNIFESETEQLILNTSTGTMQAKTPRLEGAVIKENRPVKIGCLLVKNCSTPAAISIISLDTEKDLTETNHMLLVISTDCVNTGMTTNSNGNRLLTVGTAPLLMKTGEFSLALANNRNNTPAVYALNLDGTRAQEVPAEQLPEGLKLNINTSQLKYCTPFFEIIYK